MVRIIEKIVFSYDENGIPQHLVKGTCKAGDTLPTENIVQGSRIIEIDTGKVRVFDEAGTSGNEWPVVFTM